MDDREQIELTAVESGQRLDKFVVAAINELSRTRVQTMIKEGLVTVDGQAARPGFRLKGGEHVRVTIIPQEAGESVIQPEAIPLAVVHEDDHIAVIDKPAGMVIHPAAGHQSGTLVNALLARWPQVAEMEERVGIVHRLDRDTSGLLVIAKHAAALENLMAQFQARTVEKTYLALAERPPKTPTGRIDAPIGRDPKQRKRMAVVRDGKPAVTTFTLLDDQFRDGQALLSVKLLTGRTHQIRVHLAFIGCPIVGDTVYGFRKQRIRLKRQFLHASRLCIDHPANGERLCFQSDLPAGLRDIIGKLR